MVGNTNVECFVKTTEGDSNVCACVCVCKKIDRNVGVVGIFEVAESIDD